ncbi:MAG: hypothetical protein COS89_08105 [Deltaproteobacteria bacterium CG07_land_8_20_14_0_80_38_7]|nr:MAG: hypothetical protein COS89_08105 [Deltaproteobacteria bacterium CG07_land_8_20_14_0_80_38_7]
MTSDLINHINFDSISYNKAWKIQEELHAKRVSNQINDTILLLEHNPVFTLGKRVCPEDIKSSIDSIKAQGIEIIQANRGGRITYHGPGQLVCYFICSIDSMLKTSYKTQDTDLKGIKKFVWLLEELCIKVLAEYNISGTRDPLHPGIWIGRDKIAAIGLHINNGVTQHGLSFNVNCNLEHYKHIVPCGIADRGITSLSLLTTNTPSIHEIKIKFLDYIAEIFEKKVVKNTLTHLQQR